MFKGKNILITGGTGSFGSAFIIHILKKKIPFKEIRIFSRDEKKQEDLRKFFNSPKIKYYIGYTVCGVGEESVEVASKTNEHIKREVGDIRWCSLDAALSLIRKENPEKRDVLLRVDKILKKFCPLQLGPLYLLDLSGGH